MIEDVPRINANREAPGLGNLHAFLDRHVRAPIAQTLKDIPSKRAAVPRQRSLEDHLTGGILQRVQVTESRKRGSHNVGIEALRIPHFRVQRLVIGVREHVALRGAVGPGGPVALAVEGADDIRHALVIQHAHSRNVERRSGTQVENPTGLPVFDDPSPETGRVPREKLARADGQFERAVVDQDVFPMRSKQAVVQGSVRRIRDVRRARAVGASAGSKTPGYG
jgi:hypothetical protein